MNADHRAGPRVAATIALDAAAAAHWDAVVVGAGPAGSATALRLARGGRRVLLVDRSAMPRPKVCGSCLSVRALDELRRLLAATPDRLVGGAVPLDTVRLVAARRAVRLPLPAGGVVSREALDTALVRAAIEAGADWLPGLDVAAVAEGGAADPPLSVSCRAAADPGTGCDLVATHVVIAAGLVDHVRLPGPTAPKIRWRASRIGIGGILDSEACELRAGELVMAVGHQGYCDIVRLEDGRIDVAAAVDRGLLAASGSPREAVRAILHDAGATGGGIVLTDRAVAAAAFRATPPLTHAAPLVAGPARRVFRVGDAAGYVEPFTGEGIGWALAGARVLAAALLDADDPATAYEAAHAACLRGSQRRCRGIAAALRHAAIVGSAIRAARVAPGAARPVVSVLVGAAGGTGGWR